MKIILSRKGFDAKYGGQPSPIMPDGTLLSLPIPLPQEKILYTELFYNEKSYFKIIQDLKSNTKQISENTSCHLDPDIRKNIYSNRVENWKPIFGQCDAAQGHLINSNVEINDIFLFFGWFRQTEYKNGKLCYKIGSPDVHLIYSYLQIGEIHKYGKPFPEFSELHPHRAEKFFEVKSNCLYVGREKLSLNENLKGADSLKYKQNLVLTKNGMTRSKWELPDFFRDLNISYHNKNSFKEGYFQSAAIGQEFVIQADKKLQNWTKELIENN